MARHVTRNLWAASAAYAAVLFAAWCPGVVTADSWWQWQQAVSGKITDWHPVGLAALMRATILMAPGLSPTAQLAIVFALQTALFAFALCLLVVSLVDAPATRRRLLFGAWLYLPFWFALAFVYKDAWFLGAFLAAVAFLVRLHRPGGRWANLLGVAAFGAMAILNRHNAIVALALAAPGVALLTPHTDSRRRAITGQLAGFAGIAAGWVGAALVTGAIAAERVPHMENLVALIDVFGIVTRSDQPVQHFEHLATYQEVGARAFNQGIRDFRYDDMSDYLIFLPESIYPPDRAVATDNALRDILHLAPRQPGDWLEFKALMLMQLLGVSRYDFIWGPVQQEPFAAAMFATRPLLPQLRGWLSRLEPSLIARPGRPIGQLTWLTWPVHHFLVLIVALVASGLVLMRRPPLDEGARAALLCLWVGFAAFLPYLLLCPGGTFRYMMASGLLWWMSGITALMSLVRPVTAPSRR
jgi:hypothetical protein